jgi:hypothetical protein
MVWVQRARSREEGGGSGLAVTLLVLVALCGGGLAWGEEVEVEVDPLGRVAELLPEGRIQRGVTLPGIEEGRLGSLVLIEELERVDGRILRMRGVVISQYQEGEEVMRVSMERGLYDMETGLLRSESRALVQKVEMDIEGDVLIYDSKRRTGKLEGDVETLIYRLEGDEDEDE